MPDVDDLIELQLAEAAVINALYENFKKSKIELRTKGFLLAKQKAIESQWQQFSTRHKEIFCLIAKEDRATDPYLVGKTFMDIYSIHENMLVRIEEWFQPILADEMANSLDLVQQVPSQQRECRLPQIKIETFTGDYSKWMAFKNIYNSLIHSKIRIPPIEKFHYLLSFLSGEAARVVSHYALTEANYASAYEELLNRYDNERAVVDSLIINLLGIPAMTKESGAKLRDLLNTVKECVNSLNNWGIDTSTWDPILVVIVVSKFDSDTRRLWESSLTAPKKLQQLEVLYQFIDNRFLALENQQKQLPKEIFHASSTNSAASPRGNYSNPFSKNSTYKAPRSHQTFLAQTNSCDLCKGQHKFRFCPEFEAADTRKKMVIVKKISHCINCFGKHSVSNCTSQTNCSKCHKRHNVLLHLEDTRKSSVSTATSGAAAFTAPPANVVTSHFTGGVPAQVQVLLATTLVRVYSHDGSAHTLRCLVDPGSQSSFITKEATQFLQLKKKVVIAPITGLGAVNAETSTSLVDFTIFSRRDNEFQLSIQALVLSSITAQLPTTRVLNIGWEHIRGIELADPTYYRPGKIDVLLGADVGPHIMLNGLLCGKPGEPMAQNTKLGWILSGQVSATSPTPTTACHVQTYHLRDDIDTQLCRFWEIEELPMGRKWTAEEEECEKKFVATHTRDPATGRYTVSLPFKEESKPLGKSRFQALSRLFQLEKKLEKKESHAQQYHEVISEYITMNHMELIATPKETVDGYYLPHHAVIKESSSTTKLRVVFDASARTTSGESLNDQLLVGPTVQEDLPSILLRWRTHRVVISADVAKMYRQIRVRDEDSYFQKMLWRESVKDPVKEYRLQTLTFGTASAAYLAIRTLRQLAIDEAHDFEDASKVTLRDFYVDDLLTGADNVEAAMDLQKQLTNMLAAGGLQLRKWISNSATLLSTIPKADREVQLPLSIEMTDTTKTLGIHYHPSTDSFQFKISLEVSDKPPTKRSLLSESAKLFDPLGWLSPVIIKAKIMFQKLWKEKMSWDQELEPHLRDQWIDYRRALVELEQIFVPRWIGRTTNCQRIELHAFCDASEAAYAAVIYTRIINMDGSIQIALFTSKTKVAPIKSVSLPRLELCGAVLATRLLQRTKESLHIAGIKTFAWTDSTIVLAWLNGHPSKWKTFVANRVSEIQEHLKREQWRHIRSEHNPADCASRGVGPSQLKDQPLWWYGPPWFKSIEKTWPTEICTFQTSIDSKNTCTAMLATKKVQIKIIERFSSLIRLLRVVGACLRFADNCKYKKNRRYGPLTVIEFTRAQVACVRMAQAEAFPTEVAQLAANQTVNHKSDLGPFTPYLDEKGLIRLGGRLGKSELSYQQKHQWILPSKGHLTNLLIKEAHIRGQHGGALLVMTILRKRFWIIRARNAVKAVIRQCIICIRYQKAANEQIMGSIPKVRITEAPPFKNVGIDYAGPINIKASKLRTNKSHKAWIALFVCMCTKAVHIEVVTDLTTEAYLAAFTRFVSRRGLPSNIYSDNAKTYVGADASLTRSFNKMLQESDIPNAMVNQNIQWHYIPPRSPHFGGLWESGIKSMKKHLHRVLDTTMLTYEEMTTVLTAIEANMNSRPLTPLTEDINDLSALTPGHFLIGRELVAVPSEDYADIASNRLTKWKLLRKIQQDYWRRWRAEYLCGLQQRNKWSLTKKDAKVGDMVLLKEDNVPPSHWTLCRVVDVHPGSDGHVRVVTINTPSGHFKRAISKLCPLPIEA